MSNKKANVPELRFPEFRDNWNEVILGNIFLERIEKKHSNKIILAATQDKGVIPYELMDKSVIRDRKNLDGYKLVLSGDFVISLRSFEGGFEYSEYDGIISPAYVVLYPKINICNYFFRIYFKQDGFIQQIQNSLNNSLRDGKSISYKQASALVINLPEIEEQQKIADCLSSLDDLIAAQTQKMTALQAYKKGLMQRLFPQEGESVPKVRFGEFEGDGEWEKKILSQIATINPSKEKFDDDMLVSFVPMTSVSENGFLKDYKVKTFQEVKKGFTYFRDEDIIFAKITPCFENGKAALLGGLKNGIGFGSTEFHVIRINKNICLPHFLFSYLYSEKLIREGKLSMTGSAGQQRVPVKFFEDYQVNLPSLKEQQKIADCLSSLDKKIAKTNEKLTALLAHKKGLMQKLFPAVDEAN